MCFDFHTHFSGKNALVSAPVKPDDCTYWSVEVHPWHLPETFAEPDENFLSGLRDADALGEIGLDRLRGPALDVQRKYLAFLLAAAEKASKPVVIHAVRCDSELDGELKNFSGRVLVHGFRGSEAKLLHHLELGRFVSFAPGAWREHCSLLKCRGLNNIGLETDDSQMNITDIYREAEQFFGVPQWENTCRENFLRFIG